MAKKIQELESLGSVLEQSLKRFELAQRLEEYGIWPLWNDVVGGPIARNAQPEKIRHGTLFVKVTSPVWMQQLQFMKDMIADKLNQRLGNPVVKNIFFMVGQISPMEAPSPPQGVPQRAAEAEAGAVVSDEFLAAISDPAIRAAFKKLLKSYSRSQAKR